MRKYELDVLTDATDLLGHIRYQRDVIQLCDGRPDADYNEIDEKKVYYRCAWIMHVLEEQHIHLAYQPNKHNDWYGLVELGHVNWITAYDTSSIRSDFQFVSIEWTTEELIEYCGKPTEKFLAECEKNLIWIEDELDESELLEIVNQMYPELHLSEREAYEIISYHDGHGYVLGYKDGSLYCGDTCDNSADIPMWEKTTFKDIISNCSCWAQEFIDETKKEGGSIFATRMKHLKSYEKDSKLFDDLVDRYFEEPEKEDNNDGSTD